jgi:hypothetical protein
MENSPLTPKQHLDAALRGILDQRGDTPNEDAARNFSIAITSIEDAKMRYTRGRAIEEGIFNEVDLDLEPGMKRARDNFHDNVVGNPGDGITRSPDEVPEVEL